LHESESTEAKALVLAIDQEMHDIFEKFAIEPADATPVPPEPSTLDLPEPAKDPVAATRPAAPVGSPEPTATLPTPAAAGVQIGVTHSVAPDGTLVPIVSPPG
jgi:hypothetical protein